MSQIFSTVNGTIRGTLGQLVGHLEIWLSHVLVQCPTDGSVDSIFSMPFFITTENKSIENYYQMFVFLIIAGLVSKIG